MKAAVVTCHVILDLPRTTPAFLHVQVGEGRANARLMSCGIKNVSRTGRARGGKALELQLSVQFIQARYFRINFTGAGQNAKVRGKGEKQDKINASAREW